MKCTIVLSVLSSTVLGLLGATAVLARAQPAARRTGPGVQAARDANEPAVLEQCKTPPPPAPSFTRGRLPPGFRAPSPIPASYTIDAIPDVIAAGAKWKRVWKTDGNNADGIVATKDGGILIAQNDNSAVVKLDRHGHASVLYRNTRTGGALSYSKNGELFINERELNPAIWELSPERKLLANRYQGDPLDCLGNVLNDLTADSRGGVYFTQGGLFYADAHGVITRYGQNLRTNGIILSPDEKTLYVTNGATLAAFDVQPDGSLTHQREFAKLPAPGDGSVIDAQGRIYVTGGYGVHVFSPQGEHLGDIPAPYSVISLTFSGRDKKTLYAVAETGMGFTQQAAAILTIPMIAQGYEGRPK